MRETSDDLDARLPVGEPSRFSCPPGLFARVLGLGLLGLGVVGLGAPSLEASSEAGGAPEPTRPALEKMIEAIEADALETARATGREQISPRVLDALRRVPRHEFVPAEHRRLAYDNRPLPIGAGQTISQPFVVALMTDLLELGPEDRVLEIGTGSGYQAAVLGELVAQVYTIEIVPELGERATQLLERLGIDNVQVRIGDGFLGWPEEAPFDAILLTAAIGEVPQPLLEQLAPGGRLVLPEGDPRGSQVLVVVTRDEEGALDRRRTLPVRFVPFTGEGAASREGG